MNTKIKNNASSTSSKASLFALLILALSSIQLANAKELMYAYDFESGTFAGLGHDNAGNGNAPFITSQHTRAGNYAMKSHIHRLTSKYSYRTEVSPAENGKSLKYTFGDDYWVGFSILLPSNYKEGKAWELLAQWHAVADSHLGELGHPPPLALETSGGTWRVVSRWDATAKTPRNSTENAKHKRYWNINPVSEDKGRWVDWVFHFKFSWKTDGVLQVWKNGKLVVDHVGPNAYNDRTAPYFKMGLYLDWFNKQCCAGGPVEKTVFHDELRVMRGADVKYEDVAPPGAPSDAQTKVAPSPPIPPNISTN